jgi:surfeit locus 1 family protein
MITIVLAADPPFSEPVCYFEIAPPMRRLIFQPRLVPTLAALCALALTLYLAIWQQGRAAEKRALQSDYDRRTAMPLLSLTGAEVDAQSMRFRRATVSGTWEAGGQIYIDNKFDRNAVGYHVLTPLRIEGSPRYVLINRGWVPRGPEYPVPPKAEPAIGVTEVQGTISQPSTKFLELARETIAGNVWQNITLERYRAAMKLDVLPIVLLATSTDAGLRVVTEQPDAGVAKHVEYMLTWYSLAATVAVLWLVLNLRIRDIPDVTAAEKQPHTESR